MNYLGEVWRPVNRQPEEGQEVLVQCIWENGSVGYKECQFLDNQFVFFKPDGRGYYLTAVTKWIPMPNNELVENENKSSNHIPIECVYPYLLRELHQAKDKLKAMGVKVLEANKEVHEANEKVKRYAQDSQEKSKYIEKLNRKVEDIRLSYASLMDKENTLKQRIKELLK